MITIADENIPFVAQCFSSIGPVHTVSGRKITAGAVTEADILLVRSITTVDRALLSGSKVRFVATATIGTEHVDEGYLRQANIGFASAPGSNANSVAEYIAAALLDIGRKQKVSLEGKSIGIIGVGNVGSRVEKKVKALGMRTYLNDPPLQRQTGDSKYLPLERLFDCDFITIHTPLIFEGIDKTFHLADEGFFKSVKKGCVFLNTSRGGVVDTQALKSAMKSGTLAAVVLDVWENEPDIDQELLRMADLATPHIAGYSFDGKVAGMIMIYEAACKYFGLRTKYSIDDFLPPPKVPQIQIDSISGNLQDVLHQAVQQVYPINRDDFNTKQILMVPPDKRGKFFDDLRKNYSVRREFQNTTIAIMQGLPAAEDIKRLAAILKGLGFKAKQ